VALAGLHSPGLRVITADDATVALRLLADRRDELGIARTQTINRLHRLLLELLPGGAKKFLSAAQAKELLGTVRPRDVAGKTRRRLAAELVTELTRTDKRIKAADAELKELVTATGSSLLTLHGIGPSGAARLLGDVGDIARFADKGRFASWNGTAPLDASSGDQNRHRLSRAGNRRINRVLHIMAVVALRNDTKGRAYYRRRLAAGNPPWKRCGASNGGCRHRLPADDQRRPQGRGNGPGRTRGDACWLQRGRLQPLHRRFGEVTSRTRRKQPYARPGQQADPFSSQFPAPLSHSRTAAVVKRGLLDNSEDRRTLTRRERHPLDIEGCQIRTLIGQSRLLGLDATSSCHLGASAQTPAG
jgi:Transposase IS116/IS110/IS902 family